MDNVFLTLDFASSSRLAVLCYAGFFRCEILPRRWLRGKQSGQGSRLTRSRRRGNLYPIAAGEHRRAMAVPKSFLAVGCGLNNPGKALV